MQRTTARGRRPSRFSHAALALVLASSGCVSLVVRAIDKQPTAIYPGMVTDLGLLVGYYAPFTIAFIPLWLALLPLELAFDTLCVPADLVRSSRDDGDASPPPAEPVPLLQDEPEPFLELSWHRFPDTSARQRGALARIENARFVGGDRGPALAFEGTGVVAFPPALIERSPDGTLAMRLRVTRARAQRLFSYEGRERSDVPRANVARPDVVLAVGLDEALAPACTWSRNGTDPGVVAHGRLSLDRFQWLVVTWRRGVRAIYLDGALVRHAQRDELGTIEAGARLELGRGSHVIVDELLLYEDALEADQVFELTRRP